MTVARVIPGRVEATDIEVEGVPQEIQKDPITDARKKSHNGLMKLVLASVSSVRRTLLTDAAGEGDR